MCVFDATPLIYLGTAERLELLAALSESRVVPERVYDEVVVAGVENGHADARRVERAVEAGILDRVTVAENATFDRLRRNEMLSEADAAVLAAADRRGGTAVVDEQYGRDVADAEGIPTRGTAYLVLDLLADGALEATEARRTLDAMLDAGWYCAPDLYAELLGKIDALS